MRQVPPIHIRHGDELRVDLPEELDGKGAFVKFSNEIQRAFNRLRRIINEKDASVSGRMRSWMGV